MKFEFVEPPPISVMDAFQRRLPHESVTWPEIERDKPEQFPVYASSFSGHNVVRIPKQSKIGKS